MKIKLARSIKYRIIYEKHSDFLIDRYNKEIIYNSGLYIRISAIKNFKLFNKFLFQKNYENKTK